MKELLNFYNVRIADIDEDLYGLGELETRKFCENNNQQFDFRVLNFYMKALQGVSRNRYSSMIVCKSTFDDYDSSSQYLGFLHGNINYGNSREPQFMLNGMYVLPDFRDIGIGRSLIVGLEESLLDSDAKRIFSCLDRDSDGFLMRCGFSMGGKGADVFKRLNK